MGQPKNPVFSIKSVGAHATPVAIGFDPGGGGGISVESPASHPLIQDSSSFWQKSASSPNSPRSSYLPLKLVATQLVHTV